MKPAKKTDFVALAAARKEALAGKSPRARGEEKKRIVLDWVYRWGYSSPAILDYLVSKSRRGFCKKLVDHDLLIETPTIFFEPRKKITLSKTGIAIAEKYSNLILNYQSDPDRYSQQTMVHSLACQLITINSIKKKAIIGFKTEIELAAKSVKGKKQPDIIWEIEGGELIAVEVELTSKHNRAFHQFITGCCNQLDFVSGIVIASNSQSILDKYEKAFEPGTLIPTYQKNERGNYTRNGRFELTDQKHGIQFLKIRGAEDPDPDEDEDEDKEEK